MNRNRVLTAILFSLPLLTACAGGGTFDRASIPDLPLQLVEAISPSGWVLFQDGFSDPGSGWTQSEDSDGRREYVDDAFRLTILRPDWYYWSTPRLKFSDVHIDVRMNRLAGDGVTAGGIVCRYQDQENFYAITITSDGYFGISKVVQGREQLIGQDMLSPSGDIFGGDAANFLGVDCIGDTLRLWINGVEALEVHDPSFERGEAGIIGAVLEGQAGVLEFDNFSVLKP